MSKNIYWLVVIVVLLFSSCARATFKAPYYSETEQEWERLEKPNNPIKETVFLLGDAGAPTLDEQQPLFRLLQKELSQAEVNSTVVFLGDNIYPLGMPAEGHEDRKKAVAIINESLIPLQDFPGRIVFIPGNHDWEEGRKGGVASLKRQEIYIENYLEGKDVFRPSEGCAGPDVISINDQLVIISIDSHWYLEGYLEGEQVEDCPISEKSDYFVQLEKIIKEQAGKKIILVAHHPIYSNGNHGGYFQFKDHIIPLAALTKKWWGKIPIPIIGSIYPIVRKHIGHIQDIPHKENQKYGNGVKEIMKAYPGIIFACGHEHALQHFAKTYGDFIVSGAGSKQNFARKGKGASFIYSHRGYSKLEYYENGQIWMEFWIPSEDGSKGILVYRTQMNKESK